MYQKKLTVFTICPIHPGKIKKKKRKEKKFFLNILPLPNYNSRKTKK